MPSGMAALKIVTMIRAAEEYLCSISQPSIFSYFASIFSTNNFFSVFLGGLTLEVSMGMTVSDMNSEATKAMMILIATWYSCTAIIDISLMMLGRKTITVVRVPAVTAMATLFTPLMVASFGSLLSICVRCMLSVTTTALSTSIPMASISPIMERIFRERSRK